MSNLRFLYVVVIQLSLYAAHASVITKTLNEHLRITAPIAAAELNRISVQGDRIHQIFGAEGKFSVETDNESGQLFLKPLNAAERHALNLTIITENGNTQDLKLLPQKGDAVSLVLKSTAPKGKDNAVANDLSYSERIIHLIQHAHRARPGKSKACDSRLWPEPLRAECLNTWRDGDYSVTSYRLHNTGDTTLALTEESLAQPDDRALALQKQHLVPQGATTLIIVQQGAHHD